MCILYIFITFKISSSILNFFSCTAYVGTDMASVFSLNLYSLLQSVKLHVFKLHYPKIPDSKFD